VAIQRRRERGSPGGDGSVEGVSQVGGHQRQVDQVASQGQEAAVLEQQALDDDHRGYGQGAGMGTEQDGQQDGADHVAAGARQSWERDVDHLCGKDEGGQDAHE
jgi:hypothetical protein